MRNVKPDTLLTPGTAVRHTIMTPYRTLLVLLGVAAPLAAQQPMSPTDSARHVLSRLAYGGTPGEVAAVAKGGVLRWIDQQLDYKDTDDRALDSIAERYPVMGESRLDMQQMLQNNQLRAQRAQAAGDSSMLAEFRATQRDDRRSLQNLNAQLQSLTVARAVESEHQLDEVLADFWVNHFNVYINKGQDRAYFADYLEHTIRPHVLGKFEDLLLATAQSPAMLFYLDNAESVADATAARTEALQAARANRMGRLGFAGRGRGRLGALGAGTFPGGNADQPKPQLAGAAAARAPHGLNENYARELMELHTLGVDGGYTQADVIAVARVLTGWSIDRKTASFIFRPIAHDNGAKVVLGQPFDAGHEEDEGIRLLKWLANAPATMHHVSAELCSRFVADTPPDGCVDDAVRAWQATGGDMRAVMRAIIQSPDFWAAANLNAKVKPPLGFVASALRAIDATPDSTPRVAQRVAQLGEPLFQKQTPDGYGETEADWVNSGALLARWNFAMQLASGRMPGVTVDLDRVVPVTPDHAALLDAVNQAVLGGAMTDHTRSVILKQLDDVAVPAQARALAIGMAIGSPEFQRQ